MSHLCAFPSCPLPGAWTDSVKPDEGSRWYCTYHDKVKDDPAAGARIVEDLRRNGIPKPVDWREELVQAHIKRHDLIRRKGESLEAFRARCTAAAPKKLDLSMDRKMPSRSERIDALAERFAEHAARLEADGEDKQQAERQAIASIVEELLPA